MQKDVRRVVTGHDASGDAIVIIDDVIAPQSVAGGNAYFAKVWTTAQSPVDNNDASDGAKRGNGLTVAGGTVLRFVDFPPGARSPLHRTNSLDYGIVLAGEIDMELDAGRITRLKTGDVAVQRGTIHAWINNTTEWARMAFVLIDATPATIDDRALEPNR